MNISKLLYGFKQFERQYYRQRPDRHQRISIFCKKPEQHDRQPVGSLKPSARFADAPMMRRAAELLMRVRDAWETNAQKLASPTFEIPAVAAPSALAVSG